MAVFKCKMCGGTIEFEPGASIGICDSCGTKQTLPRLDDDKRANLYDRANHFRRSNDYDKAMSIYEQILNEDNTDAEAYWSIVLCRYGIEYVEDPTTHKRIPTVNRAQFTSIHMDEDYKSALKYADSYQRDIYEKEADAIDRIQKGILDISSKEEPFDVFICYKETDANGRRTQDSVLANDLYHQLTQEGFKVFFARITLEDKLGAAYEPYIFAALNSAKVMVVIGTRPEYFKAVWVKNEWSRFLALVKASGGKKILIPAYRDMDPYDLPEEFSHLQARDMSKLGFMQDLVRGIRKIAGTAPAQTSAKEAAPAAVGGGENRAKIDALVKKAFAFLKEGNWDDARLYRDKILDIDKKNAEAYLISLMAELKVRTREDLGKLTVRFDDKKDYKMVLRYGDNELEAEMRGYIEQIKASAQEKLKKGFDCLRESDFEKAKTYSDLVLKIDPKNAEAYLISLLAELEFTTREELGELNEPIEQQEDEIQEIYEKILRYGDEKLNAEMRGYQNDAIYDYAIDFMSDGEYEEAIAWLESISDWRDAKQKIEEAERKKEEAKRKAEEERKKKEAEEKEAKRKAEIKQKRANAQTAIGCLSIILIIIGIIAYFAWFKPKIIKPSRTYKTAISQIHAGNVIDAYEALISLGDYKDSAEKASELKDQYIKEKLPHVNAGDTVFFGNYEQDKNDSNGKEAIEWTVLDKKDNKVLLLSTKILSRQAFHEEGQQISGYDVTWETCTLRTWLNQDFLNSAFSDWEKSCIPAVTVTADRNPENDTNPGNDTTDQVFLLSADEVAEYLQSNDLKRARITDAAKYYEEDKFDSWMLRTKVDYSNEIMCIYSSGDDFGRVVYYECGVRPAIWVDLTSIAAASVVADSEFDNGVKTWHKIIIFETS